MGKDLRGFLEEVKGETVTVDGPTDPRLGISAYVEAYERLNQYPVLFFVPANSLTIAAATGTSPPRPSPLNSLRASSIPKLAAAAVITKNTEYSIIETM